MSKNNNKVTDLSYLNEISKGNAAFIKEMIGIFLHENPEEIQLLEKAINEKDYTNIKAYAHKMKSTIPFVGIDKLIEKDLEIIEQSALKNSNLEKIKELFSKIKQTCTKASEELKSL